MKTGTTETRLPQVLLIDDNAEVLETLSQLLEDDFKITACSSIERAFVHLADNKIEMIVSDMNLAHENAVDLHLRLAKEFPHLLPHFLILTGGVFDLDHQRYLKEHNIKSEIKTFEPEKLIQLIKKMLI